MGSNPRPPVVGGDRGESQ